MKRAGRGEDMKRIVFALMAGLAYSPTSFATKPWEKDICNSMWFPIEVAKSLDGVSYGTAQIPNSFLKDGSTVPIPTVTTSDRATGWFRIESGACDKFDINLGCKDSQNRTLCKTGGKFGARGVGTAGAGWQWYQDSGSECIKPGENFDIVTSASSSGSNIPSYSCKNAGGTLVGLTHLDPNGTFNFHRSNYVKKGADAPAAPPPPPKPKPLKNSIIFVNGVFNDDVGWAGGVGETYRLYRIYQQGPGGNSVPEWEVFGVRNHTYGLGDLPETLWQKAVESSSDKKQQKAKFQSLVSGYWQILADTAVASTVAGSPVAVLNPTSTSISIAEVAQLLGAKWVNGTTNQDIAPMVSTVRGRLAAGYRVVLVAHSQGNLFANAVYDQLTATEKLSVGIVSIANPGSHVSSGDGYVSVENDRVMNWLRLLYSVLPGNAVNTPYYQQVHEDPWLHHEYVSTYSRGDRASGAINARLIEVLNRLVAP